jgi:outer membrane protein OmpA-like peptidoglycan-associated protein
MRLLLLVSFLWVHHWLFAQNHVANGGFERQAPAEPNRIQVPIKPCTFASQADVLNTCALGWRTFDSHTPDLLEWDSLRGCPNLPAPHKGNRMVGLIMYHPFQDGQFAFDYHELIQGSLTKPLEKGKTYRVSFWVNTNDSIGIKHLEKVFGGGLSARVKDERFKPGGFRPIYCGNFGFYFSNNKIQNREEFMQSQIDFPVKPQLNHAEIVYATGDWQKITLRFTADQPYKYFLFGNFFSDAVTPINMGEDERMQLDERNQALHFWAKKKRIAYYLFDDFAIVEDVPPSVEQALLQEKQYTFQSALLFDTGKSELKPESSPAIDELATALKKNPKLHIEIGGHTDDVGNNATNQVLSEQRAQALYQALIEKQVPPAQMQWKGYGEGAPTASNDHEQGRQQNRRVTCKVLE